jgi:hypothetical protein
VAVPDGITCDKFGNEAVALFLSVPTQVIILQTADKQPFRDISFLLTIVLHI